MIEYVFDFAGVAALLSVVCGGAWTVLRVVWQNSGSRETRLEKRERAHDELVDMRLRAQGEEMQALHLKLSQSERNFAVVVSVLTILIDQHIAQDPRSDTLLLIGTSLRRAFPVEHGPPNELMALLARLDAVAGE